MKYTPEFLDTPVAQLPGLAWTERLHPKLTEKPIIEAGKDTLFRLSRLMVRDSTLIASQQHEQKQIAKINDAMNEFNDDSTLLVQIGAHDGEFDDPFFERIRDYNWRALLVEPQTEPYTTLAQRYSQNPRVNCVRTAVSPTETQIDLWTASNIKPGTFGSAIACHNPEQVRREVRRCIARLPIPIKLDVETVPAITLSQLFDSQDLDPSSIDIFATDTEGHDAKIVKSLIEQGIRPPAILWEHLHVPTDESANTSDILHSIGYSTIKTHKDTLAYL